MYDDEDPKYDEGAFLLRRFETPSLQPLTSVRILAGSTNDNFSAPTLATRESDGIIGATWHNCGSAGDGSGCGNRAGSNTRGRHEGRK